MFALYVAIHYFDKIKNFCDLVTAYYMRSCLMFLASTLLKKFHRLEYGVAGVWKALCRAQVHPFTLGLGSYH